MIDLQRVRAEIPALENYTWFQNGGVSLTPAPVADEHARLMRELLTRGPMHIVYPDEEYARRQQSMRRIADFFDADADELALMRGVSEAFQTVLRGMTWQAGDEIMISEEEEAAVLLPALHLRDRHRVRVVKLPLTDDSERQLALFREAMTERTKLVALSHVTTDRGFRLPVQAICEIARRQSISTFLDLAHSAGLFPLSLHALGCDYAGLLSYKWMYSPYAAGALYVRRERIADLELTYAGGRAEKFLDFAEDRYKLHDTAERFQYGPWSWPLVHAWAFACDYLSELGLDEIWNRTSRLTARLKEGLKQIPEITLETPLDSGCSAALVALSVDGWTGDELAVTLRERWKMIVKPQPAHQNGLRISVTFFQLEEEIDNLLESLRTLIDERRKPT